MRALYSSKCGLFAKQRAPFRDSLNGPLNEPEQPVERADPPLENDLHGAVNKLNY